MNEPRSSTDPGRPSPGPGAVAAGDTRQGAAIRPGSSSLAVTLSFLWPGLGQLYLGQPRKAAAYALPWALVLVLVIIGLAVSGPALLVWLLVPSVALPVIALTAIHGVWSVVSIVDASGRSRPRTRRFTPAFMLALVLAIAVAALHLAAGWTMYSISQAGAQIFGVEQPAGDTGLDDALRGGEVPVGAGGQVPCPSDRSGDVTYGDTPSMAPGTTPEPGPTDDPAASTGTGDSDLAPPLLPCRSPSPGTSTDGNQVITDHIGFIPDHGPINVLFIGIDSGGGRTHALTDSLFVASYDRETQKLTMISIPRDTGRTPLYIGGTFRPKFNEFLGYAGRHPELFPEGGVKALMHEVGYILGTNIHFYAATDLEGFPPLVDLVGGVTVTNMTRFWLDSGEVLDPGPIHLDGVRALMYSRARHGPNNNDWERARRQQQVVKAIALKMASPEMLPRLPGLIDHMANFARTNAQPAQLPALLPIFLGAANAEAEHIVLQPSEYARRLPASETGGLYMTQLRMAVVADLSRRLFGEYSRYWEASGSGAP